MEKIVYELGDSLYINATNRCTNNCEFCVRNYSTFVYGDLWLDREPSVEEVIESIKTYQLSKYKAVVFCGYGEPTYRMDVIESISRFAHEKGLLTRINTNGHGNMINNEDITDSICKNIDTIGISLNEVDDLAYDELCHSIYGKDGFKIMLDFAKECVQKGGHVVMSVVDCIGKKKVEKAKQVAKSVGAELRIRKLI